MAIAAAIFWILFGAVYVVYKLLKEWHETTPVSGMIRCLRDAICSPEFWVFIGPLAVGSTCNAISESTEGVVSIIFGVMAGVVGVLMLCEVAYAIVSTHLERQRKEEFEKRAHSIKPQEKHIAEIMESLHLRRTRAEESWYRNLTSGKYPDIFDPVAVANDIREGRSVPSWRNNVPIEVCDAVNARIKEMVMAFQVDEAEIERFMQDKELNAKGDRAKAERIWRGYIREGRYLDLFNPEEVARELVKSMQEQECQKAQ